MGVIEDLATSVAVQCEEESPEEWLWFGRSVELVDGTTVTMPDTEENQEKYPQQSCQKEGLGFPIARMVVVLSLATCMLRGLKMGAYQGKKTGETSLLRQLLGKFQPNTIALLDKLFCNYWTLAEFLDRQVDVVTLLNPTRKVDLSRASRLGKNDYLITWERPKRPSWMDAETYAKIPETLSLRLIQSQVTQPGFRTKSLTIITTLTDADCYKSDDVVALYRMRWHAELDIRAIKTTLDMNELRCKSPEMVEKEIWTFMLAYNLIRMKLLQAAKEKNVLPIHLSFAQGLQTVAAGWMLGAVLKKDLLECMSRADLDGMSQRRVGNRAGRVEPRAVKRRPKPYPLLTMLREKARSLLRRGIDPYKKQK